MRELTSIPGFGFENSKTNANHRYVAEVVQESRQVLNVTDRIFANLNEFRLAHPQIHENLQEVTTQAEEQTHAILSQQKLWKNGNRDKILGYLPVIGIFSGIQRFVKVSRFPEGYTKTKAQHVVRGIFEFLGLGFLLLIPDLIVSAVRAKPSKRNELL